MNRSVFALLMAGILFAGGCQRTGRVALKESSPPPSVTVVQPVRKSLPRIVEQPGAVLAYETTPLAAKLSGYVKKVNVDIGDHVSGPKYDSSGKEIESGTLLAELFIPELEDESRAKEAEVVKASAEKEQAERSLDVAEASYAAMQAQVAEARAGLRRAQGNYDRWDSENQRVAKMVREKVVDAQTGDETQRQFVSAEAAREEAVAHVSAVDKSLLRAKSEIDKAKADVKVADAKRRIADTQAARLRSLLGYRFIRASLRRHGDLPQGRYRSFCSPRGGPG